MSARQDSFDPRASLFSLLLAAALVVTAACGSARRPPDEASGSATATAPLRLDPIELPDAALAPLRESFAAYEESRSLLAGQTVEGLAGASARLARSLSTARYGLDEGAAPDLVRCLEEAGAAAESMGRAGELEAAREAFSEVSRYLVLLAAADPRLAEGRYVFACPMVETFPKWIQTSAEIENPFMGRAMSGCGGATEWTVPAPAPAEAEAVEDAATGSEVAYYTCSMHPSVKQEAPGTCPICSMGLVPVTREELETGVIRLDAQQRQEIGVRTSPVEVRPVTVEIRAAATVTYDETRLTEVSLKNRGWIERLYVEETGQPVRRGEPLFTFYSPELLAAQEELLSALASQEAARQSGAPARADYLVEAARRRLSLWDLTSGQIDEVARTGQAMRDVPVFSPASGHVLEKHVVEGAAVQPGERLYVIANLDELWLEAEVYESDLPLVKVGQEAEVSFPYLPGRAFVGRVSYVYPYLDRASRTGRVRIELPNAKLELKPDMYADVTFEADRGERTVVPEEAVIYAGPRRLVFLDLGEGRLRPRTVELGVKTGDGYEVLSGLVPGDVVVTSGNFLVAAESRLKSATEKW